MTTPPPPPPPTCIGEHLNLWRDGDIDRPPPIVLLDGEANEPHQDLLFCAAFIEIVGGRRVGLWVDVCQLDALAAFQLSNQNPDLRLDKTRPL